VLAANLDFESEFRFHAHGLASGPDNLLPAMGGDVARRTVEELERLRRIEIESIDTQEAVSRILGSDGLAASAAPPTSGLVEQQAWFARIQGAPEGNERTV
jgi:hypothetical protein